MKKQVLMRIMNCIEKSQTNQQRRNLEGLYGKAFCKRLNKKEAITLWKFEIAYGLRERGKK